jgi:hypothetical protein
MLDPIHSGRPAQPVLKSDPGVDDVIAAVQKIEDAADHCFRPLALLRLPANVAIWSLLTSLIVELTEPQLSAPTNHEFTNSISNASVAIGTAIDWVSNYGRPPSRLVNPRWTPATRQAALKAFLEAHHYGPFRNCLPMWHKHRCAVTVVNPGLAIFQMHGVGARDRQVSAYLKGHRPGTGTNATWDGIEQTPETSTLFENALNHAIKRKNSLFSYGEPLKLWNGLLPQYQDRVSKIVRRSPTLELGGYTLLDFCRFYAALSTIAGAHEFLCFAWGRRQGGEYPANSAVMVRLKRDWVKTLVLLSGLSEEKTSTIVDDLTLDIETSGDLVAQPFVPLGIDSPWLAVAPPFPLASRMDENILTVLTKSRNKEFSQTTLSKEKELRAHVTALCPQFAPQGPRSLPKPLPDIDFLLNDEVSSTVLFCEAKWLRKVTRALDRINRDDDFAKGFDQLVDIQTFLAANPKHLKNLGTLPRSLDQYKNVHYIVLARDHWFWREPTNGIAVLEFEAFVRIISEASDLQLAMEELLKYEWLPVEGRDFEVMSEVATAGGVSIKCEMFYGLPRRRISLPRS